MNMTVYMMTTVAATMLMTITTMTLAERKSQADAPPQADRAAILAMAGCYHIDFDFHETAPIKPGYELHKTYHADAVEWVQIVRDEPEFISLQHLLIEKKSHAIIKHWRQDWIYENRDLLEFRDRNTWVRRELSEDEVRGTWTQKVYQIDDSPRYQATGRWVHTANMSVWQSQPTRRPLPRREYKVRDDYQALLAVNRHIITPIGWVQEEDNTKLVIDTSGHVVEALVRETGVNQYHRVDDAEGEPARQWWSKYGKYWADVRAVWENVNASPMVKLKEKVSGLHLYRALGRTVAELSVADGAYDESAARQRVRQTIESFVQKTGS